MFCDVIRSFAVVILFSYLAHVRIAATKTKLCGVDGDRLQLFYFILSRGVCARESS